MKTREPSVRRALLDSAKQDGPSPASLRKARSAVLLAAAAAATSTSAATAAATGAIRWGLLLKWLGVGMLGGAVALGAFHFAPGPKATPASSAALSVPVATALSVQAPTKAGAVSATPSLSAPTATAPRVAVLPAASEPQPSAIVSAAPSLSEEVAVLDEARRAVEQGRGREGLAVLDRYQRDYPRGRLGHEAAFVRMQALLQTGNRAAAQQLADQFLRNNPNSPLAPRVRELVQ